MTFVIDNVELFQVNTGVHKNNHDFSTDLLLALATLYHKYFLFVALKLYDQFPPKMNYFSTDKRQFKVVLNKLLLTQTVYLIREFVNFSEECKFVKASSYKMNNLYVKLCIYLVKGKGKVVPVLSTDHHAMTAYWGSGHIAPRIP